MGWGKGDSRFGRVRAGRVVVRHQRGPNAQRSGHDADSPVNPSAGFFAAFATQEEDSSPVRRSEMEVDFGALPGRGTRGPVQLSRRGREGVGAETTGATLAPGRGGG